MWTITSPVWKLISILSKNKKGKYNREVIQSPVWKSAEIFANARINGFGNFHSANDGKIMAGASTHFFDRVIFETKQ